MERQTNDASHRFEPGVNSTDPTDRVGQLRAVPSDHALASWSPPPCASSSFLLESNTPWTLLGASATAGIGPALALPPDLNNAQLIEVPDADSPCTQAFDASFGMLDFEALVANPAGSMFGHGLGGGSHDSRSLGGASLDCSMAPPMVSSNQDHGVLWPGSAVLLSGDMNPPLPIHGGLYPHAAVPPGPVHGFIGIGDDGLAPTTNSGNHTVLGASLGEAGPKPRPQPTRKRNRHSLAEWDEVDQHIRRIYVEKGHTAEEVRFEMSVIHGFEAGTSTFTKRLAHMGKSARIRTAHARPGGDLCDSSGGMKLETPQILDVLSEQVRAPKVEDWKSYRSIRREQRGQRRELQIVKRGNKRGHKKVHQRPAVDRGERTVPRSLVTVYEFQEELFHAIDAVLQGLFAAGEQNSWSVDADRFRPPPGTVIPRDTPASSAVWQLLSDQVASVGMLADAQLFRHVVSMLGQVLAGLQVAARANDPSFLVHFWTICHVLAGIPVRRGGRDGRGTPWLGWFLRRLKEVFSLAFGGHALVAMVDMLLRVWESSPRDLQTTLALSHWKAIHTLGGLIGSTHIIVLNMSVRCAQTWKSKFSTPISTVERLYEASVFADACQLDAEQRAEAVLNYLSAAAKSKYNDPEIVSEAERALSWTGGMCRERARRQRELQYNWVTRAFVFASELLATHHLEPRRQPGQDQALLRAAELELSYQYMGEAIEILRRGDVQCRIRAASLSRRLSTWIKGHPQKRGNRTHKEAMKEEKRRALDERDRTREIVQSITKGQMKGVRRRIWVQGKRKELKRAGRALIKNAVVSTLSC